MNVERTPGGRRRARTLGLLLAVISPAFAGAQQLAAGAAPTAVLSLEDAIRIATRESEALQIARAGISRASGQLKQARSQYYPQVNSSLAYARTLRSQFSALAGGSDSSATSSAPKPQSVCAPQIPATATAAERAAALAQASTCAAVQGIDFSKVGFGARNQYTLGLSVSQSVYSGGRIAGQTDAANAQERAAQIDLGSQRAQLALDVTQAYFDAVLASSSSRTRRSRRRRSCFGRRRWPDRSATRASSTCFAPRCRATTSARCSSLGAVIATWPTCGSSSS